MDSSVGIFYNMNCTETVICEQILEDILLFIYTKSDYVELEKFSFNFLWLTSLQIVFFSRSQICKSARCML